MRETFAWGLLASAALLVFFFAVVTALSGWGFAAAQFSAFWKYLVPLALGFGVQVGLYRFIRARLRQRGGAKGVLAATGTNSGVAMISCCAHYAANILPLLGATGIVVLIGQYQTELFLVGLVFNAFGIAYLARKAIFLSRYAATHYEHRRHCGSRSRSICLDAAVSGARKRKRLRNASGGEGGDGRRRERSRAT